MFIILYSWKIKSDKEQQFIDAWAEITEYFRLEFNSLGSRLHRGNDGNFYAYAQWASEEARENAFTKSEKIEAGRKMAEAVIERFQPIQLEMISDFLIFPQNE